MHVGGRSLELFHEGYNCGQCVLCALSEYTGLDDETAKNIASGLSMGCKHGELCSAVIAGLIALGIACNPKPGTDMPALTKKYTDEFLANYGALRCNDLLADHEVPCMAYRAFCALLTADMIDGKV